MKLFNSLTRKIEEFKPINERKVGLYTCGPTVYDTATIGNFRTYVLSDLMVRTFRYFDYDVKYVMNLTDVGHLTGDNLGDADTGEDRMEKGAEREGKTAWDIASRYSQEFVQHMSLLNMVKPDNLVKATEHIDEQIELVKGLEKRGFTYKIADGIYFSTEAFEKMGYKYGELSNLDELQTGARLEPNPEKKNKRDFALWKFSPKGKRRQMEWPFDFVVSASGNSSVQAKGKYAIEEYRDSAGVVHVKGRGFPGWHIECSAMSMKYLGEQFDVHVGGEDLRSTHHPNEIAQSEGATGKSPFVKYWVHGAFLLVDGGRMGKSLGNAYTLEDIKGKDYDPLALRYLYLSGSYRKQLNFTWEALDSAVSALDKLRRIYKSSNDERERTILSGEKLNKIDSYRTSFDESIANDFDFPGALSVVWEVAKSNVPGIDKADLLRNFDRVLGLGFETWKPEEKKVTADVQKLLKKRDELRDEKKYSEADKVREKIEKLGFEIEDTEVGSRIV